MQLIINVFRIHAILTDGKNLFKKLWQFILLDKHVEVPYLCFITVQYKIIIHVCLRCVVYNIPILGTYLSYEITSNFVK